MGETHRPLTSGSSRDDASRIATPPVLHAPVPIAPAPTRELAGPPAKKPERIAAPTKAVQAPAHVPVEVKQQDTKAQLIAMLSSLAEVEDGIEKDERYKWLAASIARIAYLFGERPNEDTLAQNGNARTRAIQSLSQRLRGMFKDSLKGMKTPKFLGL